MEIYNKEIKEEVINQLVKDIQGHKFQRVNQHFIKEQIKKILEQDPQALSFLYQRQGTKISRSQQYKDIIKQIRKVLHKVYGLFDMDITQAKRIIKKIKQKPDNLELHNRLLSLHRSTKERSPYYKNIYKKIFSLTKKPKSILDLGCGFNPFSFPYMNLKEVFYFASDLNKKDLDLIDQYFKIKNTTHKTQVIDLLKIKSNPHLLKDLPSFDITFLFKTIEIIELSKSHKPSELLIKSLPSKHVVASFSTITTSGKKMNYPERNWMKMMLERLNYKYKTFKVPNEIFYIINKS